VVGIGGVSRHDQFGAAPLHSHPILSFLKEIGIFLQRSNWQWRHRVSLGNICGAVTLLSVALRQDSLLDPGQG